MNPFSLTHPDHSHRQMRIDRRCKIFKVILLIFIKYCGFIGFGLGLFSNGKRAMYLFYQTCINQNVDVEIVISIKC